MEDLLPHLVEMESYLLQVQSCSLVLCFAAGVVSGAALGDFR